MRIGILGVGHLASYLVPGLLRAEGRPKPLLSPRGAATSARLAAAFGLEIAADNAALVADSDVVLLATNPSQAAEALAGLPWRPDHLVISVCAGVPLAELAPPSAPAAVARAMPLTAASIGESSLSIYPDLPGVREALASFGPIVALPDKASFEAASVCGALYGWVHALIGEMADWSRAAGLDERVARDLVAQTFRGAAAMVQAHPEKGFEAMIDELCTKGGITELGLGKLREADAFADWRAACDAVLARLQTPAERP